MADVRTTYALPADLPARLPVLPLRRGVLLPGAVAPFMVGRAQSLSAIRAHKNGWVVVAAQRESNADPEPSQLLPTAVVAKILERHPNGDAERVVLQGIARVTLGATTQALPHIEATWSRVDQAWPEGPEAEAVLAAFRHQLKESAEFLGGSEALPVLSALPPTVIADAVASGLQVPDADWHKEILTTHDPVARTERVMVALVRASEAIAARNVVLERVQNQTRDQQKESCSASS